MTTTHEELGLGAVAVLKSGGPHMTIVSIDDPGERPMVYVDTMWFDGGRVVEGRFAVAALRLVAGRCEAPSNGPADPLVLPVAPGRNRADFLAALGVDALRWADAFVKYADEDSDLDILIGWFANAIQAGIDEGARRAKINPAPPSEFVAGPADAASPASPPDLSRLRRALHDAAGPLNPVFSFATLAKTKLGDTIVDIPAALTPGPHMERFRELWSAVWDEFSAIGAALGQSNDDPTLANILDDPADPPLIVRDEPNDVPTSGFPPRERTAR